MTAPVPTNASSYNHRSVLTASGNRYACVDQPPAHYRGDINSAPTLLLCHGFPDLWYGWRYREFQLSVALTGAASIANLTSRNRRAPHLLEIAAFAARGYRVICPSQLGYGDSDKPADLRKYSYRSVAYDMNSLLNELGCKGRVIVLGHDW